VKDFFAAVVCEIAKLVLATVSCHVPLASDFQAESIQSRKQAVVMQHDMTVPVNLKKTKPQEHPQDQAQTIK